jgi:hypothetical protein
MRRALLPALAICSALVLLSTAPAEPVLTVINFREDFEQSDLREWDFPHPEDWEIRSEGANKYLHMLRNREPGVPRRPLQFARLRKVNVGSFELKARVRREGKSLIIVFNYVDTMRFYYAHLSADRGTEQPVHNGLFIVHGAPRRRIAGTEAEPALPTRGWHQVRIVRDVPSGRIEVLVDGSPQPYFSVVDRTFTCGQIGFGSFDETGDFDDIELRSEDGGCSPNGLIRPASEGAQLFGPFAPFTFSALKELP